MQLRTTLRAPSRYEEDGTYEKKPQQHKSTKPAFPKLLQQQVIPFNNAGGQAAFPSLPLATESSQSPDSLTDHDTSQRTDNRSTVALFTDVDQSAFTRIVDYSHSNDIRSRPEGVGHDEFDEFQLSLDGDDTISWGSLELSVQYQIFIRLTRFHSPDTAGRLLGLSDTEDVHIRHNVKQRKQAPFASQDAWRFLQTGGCLHPELAERYSNDLLFDGRYHEAYPLSVQRATKFLQQRNLTSSLLGEWYVSTDGNDMLICLNSSLAPVSAAVPDSGCGSSSEGFPEVPAAVPHAAQQAPNNATVVPVQSSVKRQRQLSAESIDPTSATQDIDRPKKAPKKIALQVQPVADASDPVQERAILPRLPPRNNQDSTTAVTKHSTLLKSNTQKRSRPAHMCTGSRSAGNISLRRRDKLRPTERSAEMVTNLDFLIEQSGASEERRQVAASPSSSFVTLSTAKKAPTLKINEKTGRAEVKSRPVLHAVSEASRGRHSRSSMEYTSASHNRTLPDDAADAIAMDRKYSSLSKPHPHTPTTKPVHAWKHPQLMHDASVFTPCFGKMPQEEQARLLSIDLEYQNVVQAWLIYGAEAWNKYRDWNARYPHRRHLEPAAGETWDPEAAGSVLGKSIVAQWNICQQLGLRKGFFESAEISQIVVRGYDALLRMRASIEGNMKLNSMLSAGLGAAGGGGSTTANKASEHEQGMCTMIEANLWGELRKRYRTQLVGPVKEQFEAMAAPRVILFNVYGVDPHSQQDSPAVGSIDVPGTPVQPLTQSKENVFTSKALGLTPRSDESSHIKTPDSRDLGPFGQDSSERVGHIDPMLFRFKVESDSLEHRRRGSDIKESIEGCSDVNMIDSSPLLRKSKLVPDTKKGVPFNTEAALPNTKNVIRKPSLDSPSFSPIKDEDVETFVTTQDEEQAKQVRRAAALMFQVSAARSAPVSPVIQPVDSVRQSLILDSGRAESKMEQQQQSVVQGSATAPVAETGNSITSNEVSARKPTNIKLKFGPNTNVDSEVSSVVKPAERGRTLSKDPPPAATASDKNTNTKKTTARATSRLSTISSSSRESTPTTTVETRRKKALREDKPSKNTRSRESTPVDLATREMMMMTAQSVSKSHASSLLESALMNETVKAEKKGKAKTKAKAGKVEVKAEVEAEVGDEFEDGAAAVVAAVATPVPAASAAAAKKGKPKPKTTAKDETNGEEPVDTPPKLSGGKRSGKKRGQSAKTRERLREKEVRAAQADYALARMGRCEWLVE